MLYYRGRVFVIGNAKTNTIKYDGKNKEAMVRDITDLLSDENKIQLWLLIQRSKVSNNLL
jgi:anti-sigma-K factor RskA